MFALVLLSRRMICIENDPKHVGLNKRIQNKQQHPTTAFVLLTSFSLLFAAESSAFLCVINC